MKTATKENPMNAPTSKPKMTDLFETKPCNRCGGSGEYSWNAMTGSRCFGCNGSGVALTKNGKAAREAWVAAFTRTILFPDVKPGDKVVVIDSFSNRRVVRTVVESRPDDLNPGQNRWNLTFDTTNGGLGGYGGFVTTEIELPVTAEEKRAAYETIAHMPGALGWPS